MLAVDADRSGKNFIGGKNAGGGASDIRIDHCKVKPGAVFAQTAVNSGGFKSRRSDYSAVHFRYLHKIPLFRI
jgi:hypothetical protein